MPKSMRDRIEKLEKEPRHTPPGEVAPIVSMLHQELLRIAQGTRVPFLTSRGSTLPAGKITIGTETWDWVDVEGAACADLKTRDLKLTPPFVTVVFEAEHGVVALDRITHKRLP